MRYGKDHKAGTREKIVDAAARRFRQDGIDGVSVPGLMKEVGLTHGGFYAHFPSKDALAAEAIAAGMVQATDLLSALIEPGDAGTLQGVVDAYCSTLHRDQPEGGCAIAALSGEVARQSPALRAAMTAEVKAAIGRFTETAKPVGDLSRDEVATGTLASVVGAIVLSRMCRDDEVLSDSILSATRHLVASAVRPEAEAKSA